MAFPAAHPCPTQILNPKKMVRGGGGGAYDYLSSEVRVTLTGQVGKLEQALREAGRGDVVLALECSGHGHAKRQQQVCWLQVAAGEVRQQLHVAHLFHHHEQRNNHGEKKHTRWGKTGVADEEAQQEHLIGALGP